MPASDLQSQLNDMLDDSASDTSSMQQTLGGLSSLQPPTSPPLAPGFQAGVPGPQGNVRMQQGVAMSGDDDNGLKGMQMQAEWQRLELMQQQQMSEMQNQLQVCQHVLTWRAKL